MPNLISNIALFGFNIVVGLWYTPYLVHHLGTAAYGIIPLVSQITGYMGILTSTLNSATGRYITIALEQNDDEEANRYFNASFFGGIFMVLLLIPLAVFATVYINKIIIVPEGQLTQTRWLFVCTATGFLLGTLQSPFGVSCFCRNRFDLGNAISFVQAFMRVGVIVVFFSVVTPQIWQVGLASLVAMLFGWGWSIRLWRRLTPTLKISFAYLSRNALKKLYSFGTWSAINSIGAILYLGIDLLVVNRMFGSEACGRYSVVAQWSGLLRSMVGVVVSLFTPTMLLFYAHNDIKGLTQYSNRAVKMVGLIMALPIGLVCGFSSPLLQTWMGPNFANLNWLMSLMTIHLSVNLAVIPLWSVQTTTNCLRTPAIVTLVTGIINLALAILLAGPIGWGFYGVAAAGAISITAKNAIFSPIYTAYILRTRWYAFLFEIFPIVLATTGLAGASLILSTVWDVSGWFHLAAFGAVISVTYVVVAYYVLLNREERLLAWSMLSKRVAIGRRK